MRCMSYSNSGYLHVPVYCCARQSLSAVVLTLSAAYLGPVIDKQPRLSRASARRSRPHFL